MRKNIKFEQAITELEDIIEGLENGNLTLDESIKKFEEAVELIDFCNKTIEKAEQKVSVLVKNADGTTTDMPFETEEDAD